MRGDNVQDNVDGNVEIMCHREIGCLKCELDRSWLNRMQLWTW